MRIAALLTSLILLHASRLLAGPVLSLEFLNSDFTFGTVPANQAGYDLSSLATGPGGVADLDFWEGSYSALGSVLDHQTLDVNGSGDVVGSHYFYTGGTFEIFFDLEKNGHAYTGSFVAPIETLTVSAGEHDGDAALASYVLGAGLFDASIATALGIGRHTSGGQALSQLLLTDAGNRPGVAGNHTTPQRQAWDGVNDISLELPEPGSFALVALGAGVWIRRRARQA